jgi:hypothetical protein
VDQMVEEAMEDQAGGGAGTGMDDDATF